jgi:CubicO group peptidase (beta-lactamase class C family)
MRKFVTAMLCIAMGLGAFAQKSKPAPVDKRFDGLDTAFARVLKDWHAAGFAVAVVEKNKVVYAKGFGYRDLENKKPVTPNTLFAIGSCTKAFTASLLGMLRDKDLVDFNKPVRNYLPDLKFYNNTMNDNILLKDLMCHRTGLPRHDYSWYYFTTNSRDSLMKRIEFMEPTYGVREKWQYNNFMFLLQGMIAEKLTGKTWEENVQEKIFNPLGMVRSNFSVDSMVVNSDASLGYYVKNDSVIKQLDYYRINTMGPAGAINSSVTEMANWVTTWINGGKFNGTQIIPETYVPEALSSQMVIDGSLPDKEMPDVHISNYGYGWFIASYRGHYRDEHGGNINGFSASTCIYPSDSVGIIVLSNQNGSAVPSVVRNLVADRVLGLKYIDWETYLHSRADSAKAKAKKAEATAVPNRKPDTHPSHDLKDYQGIYSNKAYGSMEVFLKNDSLFIQLPGEKLWWLRHHHYDYFDFFEKDEHEYTFDTSGAGDPLQFTTGANGDIESIYIGLEPGLKPMVFDRAPKPKEMTKDSLQKYVGEYELSGVTIKIYIKGDKTLYMFVQGQPEYELVPTDKDKFALKIAKGFSVQFNTNDKGEVIELLSIQPNGTFKAEKKK